MFSLGTANHLNGIACAGQSLPLPSKQARTIQILAGGIGLQTGTHFVVPVRLSSCVLGTFSITYTTGAPQQISQTFSDILAETSHSNQARAMWMSYYNLKTGTQQVTDNLLWEVREPSLCCKLSVISVHLDSRFLKDLGFTEPVDQCTHHHLGYQRLWYSNSTLSSSNC